MQPIDNPTAHASAEYDSQVGKTIPYYDAFHHETINLVAAYNPQAHVWVDTGGGTGALIEQAYDRFPATRFYLADPAAAMLAQAGGRLFGKQRVTIMEPVDSQHLKVAEPVDVVTAIQAHHYMRPAERTTATRNCRELLREGGLFVTFENIRPATHEGTEIAKKIWANFQIGQGRSSATAQDHLARFGVDYFPLTTEEHLQMLTDCGFRVVELLWYAVMQAGFYCIA
jgi:tRNA (cmo5U34)-methyltransferase